jgi:Spy/CpxP family protein refolding chaperone
MADARRFRASLAAMVFFRRFLPSSTLIAGFAIAALTVSCKDKPAENTADAAATTPPVASSVAPASSTPTPATSGSAASDDGRHGGRGGRAGHGGPGAMLFQAARTLELKDEQKAKLDTAEKSAHEGTNDASREAMKTAAKDLHSDLIAGIKAGKIDAAKLEPRYAAIEKAAAAARDKEAEALNVLHATLDATQRKAAVANVRAKQATREEKTAHHDDKADGGADAGGRAHGGAKRSLDRLTRGLDLDAEQQKKVDALAAKDDGKSGRPDVAEMKKSVDALLTAFEKDTFDAKKVDTFDAKKARAPMEQETKLLAQLVPILKPEQREKLATRMDKGQSPHGRRAPFGHRMGDDDANDEE